MRRNRLAVVGLLAALSVVRGRLRRPSSRRARRRARAYRFRLRSGASSRSPMATVGDPGNPSVGVWQVFKTVGASGAEA